VTLRQATVAALGLVVGLGALSNLLFVAAFQFRADWFADPALAVTGGPQTAALFRWAAVTDLFSYYLPNAVVALALWIALRDRGPVLALGGAVAALGYVLAGGTTAAALATGGSMLIETHGQPGADHEAIAVAFRALIEIGFRGIWQLFDGVLLSTWMISTGLLVRAELPGFARLSLALGTLIAIGTALNLLGFAVARDAGLAVVFVLWAAWSIWLANLVWRRRSPFDGLERARP
jgi:hypothetical protein